MEREKLYTEYVKELERISGVKIVEKVGDIRQWIKAYEDDISVNWFEIEEDGEVIGFAIIQKNAEWPVPTDYHIAQVYVLPEYRKMGRATRFMMDIVKKFPGKYSLITLRGNKFAESFWDNLFNALGYKKKVIKDIEGIKEHEKAKVYYR